MPPASPSSPTSCATSSTSRPSTVSRSRPRHRRDYGITQRLTVNARAAGPRLGKQVQQVIQAAQGGRLVDRRRRRSSPAAIAARAGRVRRSRLQAGDPRRSALAFLAGGGFVLLDTTTTPELEAEGLARDLVRAVQDARKAAGLEVERPHPLDSR